MILDEYQKIARPKTLRIYSASDYATMEPRKGKSEPDYTEHGVCGIDSRGELWFLDWWSKQCETDVGIAAWMRLVAKWNPIRHFNEGGLIDKAIGPAIRNAMRQARCYVAVEQLPSLDDKAVKLQAFHAMATAGVVHVPLCAWGERLIEQLVKFPAGRWDDMCDVAGLLGRGADKMYNARLPPEAARPQLVPFTESWLEWGSKPDNPRARYF